jgi:putative FmdB family regulatory protein
MPIYEYKCDQCGCKVERLQRMSEPAPICPKCALSVNEPHRMKKQVSRSSFRLEGGGWASDGYEG